jgi:hypothetical protein
MALSIGPGASHNNLQGGRRNGRNYGEFSTAIGIEPKMRFLVEF